MNSRSGSAPAPPCSPPPRPSRWPTLIRDRLGRETELVEITTEGDRSQAAGTAARATREHRRLRQRAARRAAGRRGRRRRPLAQGPADRTRRRAIVAGRRAPARGPARRGRRPRRAHPRRAAGRQQGRHRLAAPGRAAARPRPRFGRGGGSWERRHPDREGPLRASYDAVLLARAGLARIGRLEEVTEVLDPLQMLPAPGQGALAVECRAGDDAAPRSCAGRSTTRASGPRPTRSAPCWPPSRAAARHRSARWPRSSEGEDGEELWVRAVALSTDGALSVRMSASGDPADAVGVGTRLAKEMLADGAGQTRPDDPDHQHDRETDRVHNA